MKKYEHEAASRHPASLIAPGIQEIKLLVSLLVSLSLFHTPGLRLQMGTQLTWVRRLLGFRGYTSVPYSASRFPFLLPFHTWRIMCSYTGFLSQLVKALCLSEIVTEASFPSTESQGPPTPCIIPACYVPEPLAVLPDQAQDCWTSRRDVCPHYLSSLPILPNTTFNMFQSENAVHIPHPLLPVVLLSLLLGHSCHRKWGKIIKKL